MKTTAFTLSKLPGGNLLALPLHLLLGAVRKVKNILASVGWHGMVIPDRQAMASVSWNG